MMVPRAFLFSSATKKRSAQENEKDYGPVTSGPPGKEARSSGDDGRSPVVAPSVIHTNPVVIPPKRASRRTSITPGLNSSTRAVRRAPKPPSFGADGKNGVSPSVATLLEVTSIPRPRRKLGNGHTRRLPTGNTVEDFSKLMQEGFTGEKTSYSPGSNPLDVLLSPPDDSEAEKMMGSDYGSETPLMARSMSMDSMPSLTNDEDLYTLSSEPPTPSLGQKSPLERRARVFSLSEDCASDHPLLPVEPSWENERPRTPSPPTPASTKAARSSPRFGSFKSNLTASLRAIKSAAQTVSNFANPSVQPDDFLTRNLFTFSPELTDDRRPRPMTVPPSPALRRYLNPVTVSPAEMQVYHEYPNEHVEQCRKCAASIQMQTYNSSENAKASGAEENDQHFSYLDPYSPQARQREPRENSNFLRMVVLEMNMRRSGKLRDDVPSRVRIWLPPRKMVGSLTRSSAADNGGNDNPIPRRWVGISADGA